MKELTPREAYNILAEIYDRNYLNPIYQAEDKMTCYLVKKQ